MPSDLVISALSSAGVLGTADLMPVVQGGATRKATVSQILAAARPLTPAEVTAGVTVNYAYEPYELRRYGAAGDGATDDTAAINAWISVCQLSGTGFIYPAKYLTSGNHSITSRFNWLGRGGGEYINATPEFLLSTNATNLFNWNGLNNAGPLLNSLLISGVQFNGGGFTCSDALLALQGITLATLRDCGFHNVIGNGTRLRQFWDSQFDNCMWRSINATSATAVVAIDSQYNSDTNQNVNNLTLNRCHLERNSGTYIRSASDSNLFIFRSIDTKYELGANVTGPIPLIDIKQGLSVAFLRNSFHAFNSAAGYDRFFKLGDTAASTSCADYDIQLNDFSGIDTGTYYVDTQGNSQGNFQNNTQSVTNAVGLLVNASGRACRFEYPVNMAVQSDLNQIFHHSQSAASGFVGVDRLGNQGPQNFSIDAASLSTTKSVLSASTASVILCSFPMQPFVGSPGTLRVGVRCKSASGAGTVTLQVNTTVLTAQAAPSTTFGTLWFDVTADLLAIMGNSGSDRFRCQTGSGNAEAVTVDGFYFREAPWHYSVAFTYAPASLATLTYTSTTTTVTGATVGDHVDVYPPYDLQGITPSACVSSANTVTLSLFNPTTGTVALASGSWVVRVSKR